MGLKIRLRQQGRKNHLTYRLVVIDSRVRRDGKYVERLGWYNPHLQGKEDASVSEERINYWIDKGAQLSENAWALVARKAPAVIKGINERKREKYVKLAAKRRKAKKAAV